MANRAAASPMYAPAGRKGAGERGRGVPAGRLEAAACHTVLIGAVLLAGLPLVWMLSTSLKAAEEVYIFPPVWLPRPPRFENYRQVWESALFGRYLVNTLVVAIGAVGLQAVTVSTAAYAFSQLRFRFREPMFVLFLAAMMIPVQVTLVPNFLTLSALGWIDTYLALIVPFGASAFGIFLVRQAFMSVPGDLVEAAKLDGASHMQILLRILLPLSRATVLAFLLMSFTWRWNEYLWPLIMTTSAEMRTLPLGLVVMRAGDGASQWHVIMAATVLVLAPILALFVVMQRDLVEGVARAGIRG